MKGTRPFIFGMASVTRTHAANMKGRVPFIFR